MPNSADPGQLAYSEAIWSGSTMFAKAGHIRVQQNQGKESIFHNTTCLFTAYCLQAIFDTARGKDVFSEKQYVLREQMTPELIRPGMER